MLFRIVRILNSSTRYFFINPSWNCNMRFSASVLPKQPKNRNGLMKKNNVWRNFANKEWTSTNLLTGNSYPSVSLQLPTANGWNLTPNADRDGTIISILRSPNRPGPKKKSCFCSRELQKLGRNGRLLPKISRGGELNIWSRTGIILWSKKLKKPAARFLRKDSKRKLMR